MAAELLRDLAEKTLHAPEPQGSGRYHFVHTRGSHLHTKHFLRRSGERVVTGSIEPFERRQWIAEDGSGRLEVTREGVLVQPTGDYGPGELTPPSVSGEMGGELTARAVVKAFRQVWLSRVVTPSLQRRLLLELAECTGLVAEPGVREFEGRPGVAVTYLDEARHVQELLAFDRGTGELIGAEAKALEGARLPVPVPAVVSRTVWLTTGYRETIG